MRALERTATPALQARLLGFLSLWASFLGDFALAAAHAREAAEAGRASGNPRALAGALRILGDALPDVGDLPGAVEVLEEGLAIARELGARGLEARFVAALGGVSHIAGDVAAARAHYERALELTGRHVRSTGNAVILHDLARMAFDEGDYVAAGGYYREMLSIAAELGLPRLTPYALDGLAAVALEAGEGEQAARLAGAAEGLYETAGAPIGAEEQVLRDRYVAALRASLDAGALEREWARGRAMTLAEAVRTASALDPTSRRPAARGELSDVP
jgi:tetratricopeptide (TPR) repeat protein